MSIRAKSDLTGIGMVAGTRALPVLPTGYLPMPEAGPPTSNRRS